jgi:DNA-binding transcriptional regulator GbsR (MarR family)
VNSKDRNFSKAKLQDRIVRLEVHIEEYLKEVEDNDGKETACGEKSVEGIKNIVRELSEREERYEGYREELERSGETQKSLTEIQTAG